jgi:hypothetical protein
MAGPATLTIAESSDAIAWPASTTAVSAQEASGRPVLPADRSLADASAIAGAGAYAGASSEAVMGDVPFGLAVSYISHYTTDGREYK